MLVFAGLGQVQAGCIGERHGIAAGERHAVQGGVDAVWPAGEIHSIGGRIDVVQRNEGGGAGCYGVVQRAVRVVQFELPDTAAFGGPQEAAVFQPIGHWLGAAAGEVVFRRNVEPRAVGFGQQLGGFAGVRVHRHHQLLGLYPVQQHERELALGLPHDAGDVRVGRVVPVDPGGRATGDGDDAEAQFGVFGAGARVAELHRGLLVGVRDRR